jgi:hypothetical protein
MVERIETVKVAFERLRSAPVVDWHEATRLAENVARGGSDETLRHAAEQAMPVLRQAALHPADHEFTEAARRRLAVVVDVLHELTAPRFGRRGAIPKPLTAEQRARKMLGLPAAVQLTCDEIHQAFRRAAKTVHPDAGGDEQAFRDLAAARDVLIHPGAHKDA